MVRESFHFNSLMQAVLQSLYFTFSVLLIGQIQLKMKAASFWELAIFKYSQSHFEVILQDRTMYKY